MLPNIKNLFKDNSTQRLRLEVRAREVAIQIVERYINHDTTMMDMRAGDVSANVILMNNQVVAVFAFTRDLMNRNWYSVGSDRVIRKYISSMMRGAGYEEVVDSLAELIVINTSPEKGGARVK